MPSGRWSAPRLRLAALAADSDTQRRERPSPESSGTGAIAVLAPAVADLIAAGEVIERPASVLRELVDNAIDAGGSQIDVEWEDGGRTLLAVVDNGVGMSEPDVRQCALRHATSKVQSAADLSQIDTLGFRGEALASIAACAELELVTRPATERVGWRLAVSGARRSIVPHPSAAGCRAAVSRLFAQLPARRRFLKSARAESTMCKRTLLEKALAHPHIGFAATIDRRRDLSLPGASLRERVQAGVPALATAPLHASGHYGDVAVELVAGRPEVARRDRSGIMVFVNGRRIRDFALLQAVEYGYSAVLPGGRHPVACVFISVAPEAVDFNVHPAKLEARFRAPSELHQAVVRVTQRLLGETATLKPAAAASPALPLAQLPPAPRVAAPARPPTPRLGPGGPHSRHRDDGVAGRWSSAPARSLDAGFEMSHPPAAEQRLKLIGQVMGTFIAVETDDGIYFVDQHAAHERVIFDELADANHTGEIQQLLLPIEVELPREGERSAAWLTELERCGLRLEVRAPAGEARVVALAPQLHRLPAADISRLINGLGGTTDDLKRSALATVACKLAIKAGELLVDDDALDIAARSFQLGVQHCPHGRPVWFLLTREEALAAVGR